MILMPPAASGFTGCFMSCPVAQKNLPQESLEVKSCPTAPSKELMISDGSVTQVLARLPVPRIAILSNSTLWTHMLPLSRALPKSNFWTPFRDTLSALPKLWDAIRDKRQPQFGPIYVTSSQRI